MGAFIPLVMKSMMEMSETYTFEAPVKKPARAKDISLLLYTTRPIMFSL